METLNSHLRVFFWCCLLEPYNVGNILFLCIRRKDAVLVFENKTRTPCQKSKWSSVLFMSISRLDLTSGRLRRNESSIRSKVYMCANLPSTALLSFLEGRSLSLICYFLAIKLSVKHECQKVSTYNSLIVNLIPSGAMIYKSYMKNAFIVFPTCKSTCKLRKLHFSFCTILGLGIYLKEPFKNW